MIKTSTWSTTAIDNTDSNTEQCTQPMVTIEWLYREASEAKELWAGPRVLIATG